MDANEKAKNKQTVRQSVTPTFMPTDGEVMTLIIDYPPGDPGLPPHRHPGGPPALHPTQSSSCCPDRDGCAKATAEELIAHCGAVRRVYGAE